jgi:hypothetical protein
VKHCLQTATTTTTTTIPSTDLPCCDHASGKAEANEGTSHDAQHNLLQPGVAGLGLTTISNVLVNLGWRQTQALMTVGLLVGLLLLLHALLLMLLHVAEVADLLGLGGVQHAQGCS